MTVLTSIPERQVATCNKVRNPAETAPAVCADRPVRPKDAREFERGHPLSDLPEERQDDGASQFDFDGNRHEVGSERERARLA